MLQAILPVRSLLVAIFILMTGSAFMNTLISVQLEQAGSDALRIGLVGTAYFAGLVLGSAKGPALIRQVGHIRAFAALVALLSSSAIVYALHRDVLLWGLLRFADGVCLAAVYVCLESWLNERADARARGTVLAGYMIALYAGQALGQFIINLGRETPALPFMVASVLISLATIPIVLTRIAAPPPDNSAPMSFRDLYTVSPLGVVGITLTGIILGAFYSLGAVYARQLGADIAATALFMSVVIMGGVALQWPLGRLSDLIDRRKVIILSFAGAAVASGTIAAFGRPGAVLLGLGALFGGLAFALYPLCVSHTNDRLEPHQRVGASSGLVLLYSLGSAAGPSAGALAMTAMGAGGLFLGMAACAIAAMAFGLWRQLWSEAVPQHLQETFLPLPHTTPGTAMPDLVAPDDAATPV